MYNTGSERPPKRPVIVSQTSALRELETWVAENRFARLTDRDGLSWQLSIEVGPAATRSPQGLEQDVRMVLVAHAGVAELTRTGTLHPKADARLIDLLGEEKVELVMRPKVVTVADPDQARQHLTVVLPRLRSDIAGQSLHGTKRKLVMRWLDRCHEFGGRHLRGDGF